MDQWIRDQYKSKGQFGMTIDTRRSETLLNRKEQRNILLGKFRNIPENMSPFVTPMKSKGKDSEEKKSVTRKPTQPKPEKKVINSKRLEMLKKWKEEKNRKKQEAKRKTKPVFKVTHLEHKDDLENVYSTIKGKPLKKNPKTPMKTSVQREIHETGAKFNKKLNKNASEQISQKANVVTSKKKSADNSTHSSKEQNTKMLRSQKGNSSNQPGDVSILPGKNSKKPKMNSTKKIDERPVKIKKSPKKKLDFSESSTPSQRKSKRGKIDGNIQTDKQIIDNKSRNVENIPDINLTKTKSGSKEDIKTKRSERNKADRVGNKENDISTIENQISKTDKESGLQEEDTKGQNEIRSLRTRKENNINKIKTPVKEQDKKVSRTPRRESTFTNKSSEVNDEILELTPKNSNAEEIFYVSPFVTMSRGKTAARKEFEQRKSLNGSIMDTSTTGGSTDPRSPKAAADYFTKMLQDEIERIQASCEKWQNYKDEAGLSEEACGLIDMTIGQSNLLITKKFNQFRGLIARCRANDEIDMKITCEDLHGFWDMIYKQVTDLDKRFANLEDMKENNWLEKDPKIKTPKVVSKGKKKKVVANKTTKPNTMLKEAILAARKNRANKSSQEDVEILVAKRKSTPMRRSKNFKELPTPVRGILKSSVVKSDKRKTVGFHVIKDDAEENVNVSLGVIKGTPIPKRRSERLSLSRSRLSFD